MRNLLLLLMVLMSARVAAQETPVTPLAPDRHDGGSGVTLILTNYGFAFGGLFRAGIAPSTSFVIDVSIGSGKDEREQEFIVGPFGETVTLFKRHSFLMLPVNIGFDQRLFAETIEDNFRPFLQTTIGPVFGYQWPYFDDLNENGIRDAGEPRRGAFELGGGDFRFGLGGAIGMGAYFGEGRRAMGIRINYAAQYFLEPVELLELRPEIDNPSRQFFGSPSVSLHLLIW